MGNFAHEAHYPVSSVVSNDTTHSPDVGILFGGLVSIQFEFSRRWRLPFNQYHLCGCC